MEPQPQIVVFPQWAWLLDHQTMVIRDPHRFKVLVWHRRARKTTTALTELIKQALYRKGVYWHIFPTYGEAHDAVWRDPNMLFRVLPKELIDRTNEQGLVVYLKNGSVIQLKGADDPDALRGPNPYGIIFDEAAKIKPEAWGVLEPIIRANGGWVWFIGTPKGKNWFYNLYLRGQEGHKEWQSWILKASTSQIVAADQLAESKKSMAAALYTQEWECEWLEGEGQVFRGVKEIATAKPLPPDRDHLYVIGCDLAKHQDWTVLTVYDRTTNSQVYQDRFQEMEWPYQKAKIKFLSEHYNNALIMMDTTGIGDPIFDDLSRAGVPVEGYKFTENSKKELIEKLSIYIEQKQIKILPIDQSLLEFDNFSYEMTPLGKVRYGAPHGFHDDIVISHGLAVWGLNPLYRDVYVKPKTRLQQYFAAKVDEFENDTTEQREWNEWSEA